MVQLSVQSRLPNDSMSSPLERSHQAFPTLRARVRIDQSRAEAPAVAGRNLDSPAFARVTAGAVDGIVGAAQDSHHGASRPTASMRTCVSRGAASSWKKW